MPACPAPPSPWITRFAPLIPPGPVLDVAAGAGRHARWLAARRRPVVAVDRDVTALADAEGVNVVAADLEAAPWPFADGRFAGVIVARYLHRPLLPWLVAALAPGGVLIHETFAVGQAAFGRPRNPDFLLRPGELLTACAGLTVRAYEHGPVAEPAPAMIQRIVAVRGDVPPDAPRDGLTAPVIKT